MKTLIVMFIAFVATLSPVSALCETCSLEGKGARGGEHGHEAACFETQLATYFEVQAGLANDNLVEAQKGAKALLALASEKGCSLDGKSCCAAEIEAAGSIAGTDDLSRAREAFKTWSDTLLAKIAEGGVAKGEVYKMHCPMAFGNKGGSWLQSSKDLRNPYYGAMMLKCGRIQEAFGEAHDHSAE